MCVYTTAAWFESRESVHLSTTGRGGTIPTEDIVVAVLRTSTVPRPHAGSEKLENLEHAR